LTIDQGVKTAQITWKSNGLDGQFPGNLLASLADSGTLANIPTPLGLWQSGGTDGKLASISGMMGSVLFGKSVEDFQFRSGYAILNGPDANNTDFYGMQRYVLHYDPSIIGTTATHVAGDRNNDGKLDYNDGVVVMIDSSNTANAGLASLGVMNPLWLTNVNVALGTIATFAQSSENPLNFHWDSYRNWNLMKDFRAQNVHGGEYDFQKYAAIHGATSAEKDFWNYTETLLGDPDGLVRNSVFIYDRTQTGTASADYLYGGSGKDVLTGGAGDDVIRSGWNDDKLYGGDGNDKLYAERGNDLLTGGNGADTLDGGKGTDTADYSGDTAAGGTGKITVTLDKDGNGTATDGWGNKDTLVSIENAVFGGQDDILILTPTGQSNGTRTFDGGAGVDYAWENGVVDQRDMGQGVVKIWSADGTGVDVFRNFENFTSGGRFLPDITILRPCPIPASGLPWPIIQARRTAPPSTPAVLGGSRIRSASADTPGRPAAI